MAENLDAISETQPTSSESFEQAQFSSSTLTLNVLRFVAGASLVIGVIVAFFAFFVIFMGNKGDYGLAVSVGALVQGFIIFALFNAIALIIENLVGIRKNLTRTREKH